MKSSQHTSLEFEAKMLPFFSNSDRSGDGGGVAFCPMSFFWVGSSRSDPWPDARSSVKLSSGSPGEKSWPGELHPEGECMVTPGTRLGVLFATCLAGGGRGGKGRISLSVT